MKTSYSTILVPYDSSPCSSLALDAAVIFAKSLEADITILYVKEPHKEVPEKVLHEIEKKTREINASGDCGCSFVTKEGKVYKEIVNHAKASNTHLIIMGSHGLSGIQEFFAGSNAYRVATMAHCPVITMKQPVKNTVIKTIVMPIDGSKDSRQKVPVVGKLASDLNASVHVLVVSGNDQEEIKRLTLYGKQSLEFIQKENKDIDAKLEVMHGPSAYKLVNEYAKKVNADLIAIASEQDLESMFMGPGAQQMIHHSPFPVLSVKSHDMDISYAQL